MMLHGVPVDDNARSTKLSYRTSTPRAGAFRRSVPDHTGRMSADDLVSISRVNGRYGLGMQSVPIARYI